jgi:hypothetical protein
MEDRTPDRIERGLTTATLSALSGCGWGLIAYIIGHAAMGHRIWGGIVAAPLIGVFIGYVSRPIEAESRPVQIVVSLFHLYLAATWFAVAVATADLVWGQRHVTFGASLIQDVFGVLWGLTFTGYFLLLWPLSLLNHRLVWRGDAAGWPAPPRINITARGIRGIALRIIGLAVLGYIAWALVQAIITTVRFSGTTGMPWWVVTDVMGWSNWLVFGSLIWLTAPILASGVARAAGSEEPTTATYGDLAGVVGFALCVYPIFFFAATLIVMAVKISLVQSWATEGTVFLASHYCRNVFWRYVPWWLIGGGLIGVRRLIGDRLYNHPHA